MRRITFAALSTLSGVVLLFSYPTSRNSPVSQAIPEPSGATQGSEAETAGVTSADGTTPERAADNSTTAASSKAAVYVGDTVQTRWGPVQVQITVTDGQITKSEVLQVPWENGRDQQINSYAVPILNAEVLQAQSAAIDAVSGATVTSQGYITSIQSALDQANR